MPWKDTRPMDERMKLVADSIDGNFTITELSVIYGVSRKTVYKWIKRYSEQGIDGLKEQSRAPINSPTKTPDTIIEHLIRVEHDRMNWGPKKILAFLEENEPNTSWPSVGTIEKWLKKNGLVRKRKRRKRVAPYSEPFLDVDKANEVWSADYKGQFRTGDGLWCYPLTISDNASRYLLLCKALHSPCYKDTRKWYEWIFREYGLPKAIRTDNGTPFAGRGLTGLSRLSVWLIKLGIRPERIAVGKPQENGRHERMHRTLKEETARPPASNITAQQERFDDFIYDYNDVRPHEGISQRAPSSIYTPSSRRYPEKLRAIEYDEGVETRKVKDSGEIMYKGKNYYLTELLGGERIGITETSDGMFELCFGKHPIGIINMKLGKVEPKPVPKKCYPCP